MGRYSASEVQRKYQHYFYLKNRLEERGFVFDRSMPKGGLLFFPLETRHYNAKSCASKGGKHFTGISSRQLDCSIKDLEQMNRLINLYNDFDCEASEREKNGQGRDYIRFEFGEQ